MANPGGSGDYTLDVERSRIGFTARHALISRVRGHFSDFEGWAHLDFEDPASSTTEATIQVASVDTANGPRDDQLRVNEFLDAPAHPTISFISTRVEQIDDHRFDVTGDLTIKATTHEVTVRFDQQRGQDLDSLRFRGTTTINRRDWNVEWPPPLETGGVLVGDRISLVLDVTATKVEGS